MPKRIQMSRQHRWRPDHPAAVIVARPGPWGNPFRCPSDPQRAVDAFSAWLTTTGTFTTEVGDGLTLSRVPGWWEPATLRDRLPELAGRDLACWCPEDAPCHADVLLELANADGVSEVDGRIRAWEP
jgi:hypothetical protein